MKKKQKKLKKNKKVRKKLFIKKNHLNTKKKPKK